MSIEDDIAFLESVPVLALLGREALRVLAIGAESRYVHSGSTLFAEGDAGDAAYVIQDGSFSASASRDHLHQESAVLRRGAMLNALSLLTETACGMTVVALEPSNVLRIPRSLFLKTLEGYPQAARRMRDEMIARADAVAGEIRAVRSALE